MLKLSLGDWDLGTKSDGENLEASVKNVIIHPDFSYFNLKNDIALLELNKTVQYTERIRSICLPPDGKDFVVHKCNNNMYSNNLKNSNISYTKHHVGIFKYK